MATADSSTTVNIQLANARVPSSIKNFYFGSSTQPGSLHVEDNTLSAKIARHPRAFSFTVDSAGNGDFTDIQTAINNANTLGGGTVIIKRGTYVLSSNVTLYSNIEVRGEDRATTSIDFNGGAYGFQAIGTALANLTNIHLRDFTITGSEYVSEGSVRMDYCTACDIDGVGFLSNSPIANAPDINLNYTTEIYIRRCYFNDAPVSISMLSAYLTTISECNFDSCNNTCILIFSGSAFTVRDNVFSSSEYYSIYSDGAYGTVPGLFIANNSFQQYTAGAIYTDSVVGCQIIGNYVSGSGSNGDAANGITLTNGSYAIVVGNIIRDFLGTSAADGLQLSNMDNCVIDGNVCTGNGGYGINVSTATCDKNIVTGNQLSGNSTGGLIDSGTGTISASNVTS